MATAQNGESLDEDDWIEGGLALLASDSVDGVGIEALARKLKVTKGSFYWHFKDRAALLQAMLRTWQRKATLAIIERLEQSDKPAGERLRKILELPHFTNKGRRGALVELAIRDWARRDELAAVAVKEVDEQRLRYIAALYRSKGLKEEEASARAYLMYAYQFAETLIVTTENEAQQKSRRALCTEWLISGKP
ncbi:MAG: TetR/AcrR family transcriptional regulator [Proteobacteria bacterium]|nr:TetR/AcrR family transcriptional regulator [Pseudomonadota bacterium]